MRFRLGCGSEHEPESSLSYQPSCGAPNDPPWPRAHHQYQFAGIQECFRGRGNLLRFEVGTDGIKFLYGRGLARPRHSGKRGVSRECCDRIFFTCRPKYHKPTSARGRSLRCRNLAYAKRAELYQRNRRQATPQIVAMKIDRERLKLAAQGGPKALRYSPGRNPRNVGGKIAPAQPSIP